MRFSMRNTRAGLSALALGATMLVAMPSAHAQQILDDVLSEIGLGSSTKAKIDYSPRAPLVMPPSLDLPPPQEKGATAKNNANWPTDPDEVRSAEEIERDKQPLRLRHKYQERPVLSVYEMKAQEHRRAQIEDDYTPSIERKNKKLTPEELQAVKNRRDANPEAVAYAEPKRRRLTDPPPGYRTPAATADYAPDANQKLKAHRQATSWEILNPNQ